MAIYANIPLDQGTDFSSVVTVLGPDGLSFDLTGYTAQGQIRKNYTSSTAVDFTAAVLNPKTDGKILLSLTAEQTGGMKPGRYLFDVVILETSTGAITRVVQGQVEVNAQVTQP